MGEDKLMLEGGWLYDFCFVGSGTESAWVVVVEDVDGA